MCGRAYEDVSEINELTLKRNVKMKLRNFLYLNENILDDYLSALEGSLPEKIITKEKQTTDKKGTLGGKVVGVGAEKIVETETQQERTLTPSAKVQLFMDLLQNEEDIPFYEFLNDEIWNQLSRDEVVEFMGAIRFSKLKEFSTAISQFSNLTTLIESFTDTPIIDNKTQKAIEGIKGLGDYKNGNEIPCVLSLSGQKDYPVIAYLDDSFLKVPQESFVGDVTILCKIQRKINKGSSIELTDFFRSIKELPLNREQRKTINKKDLTMPKEIRDTVKGPAFVVIPIAIYK